VTIHHAPLRAHLVAGKDLSFGPLADFFEIALLERMRCSAGIKHLLQKQAARSPERRTSHHVCRQRAFAPAPSRPSEPAARCDFRVADRRPRHCLLESRARETISLIKMGATRGFCGPPLRQSHSRIDAQILHGESWYGELTHTTRRGTGYRGREPHCPRLVRRRDICA
jgi:hypothetical protein